MAGFNKQLTKCLVYLTNSSCESVQTNSSTLLSLSQMTQMLLTFPPSILVPNYGGLRHSLQREGAERQQDGESKRKPFFPSTVRLSSLQSS